MNLKGSMGEIDPIDAFLSPLFVISGAASLGVISMNLIGTNFALADTAFGFGGTTVSFATILAVLAVGVAYLTNRPDLRGLEDHETAAVVIAVVFILGNELVPLIESLVMLHPATQIGSLVVSAAGWYVIAYY